MKSLLTAVLCLAPVVALAEPPMPTPKFKINPKHSIIAGPLDKEGYLDYETALNERLRGKTTPETNAAVLLWKAIGPLPKREAFEADYFKALGIEAPPKHGDYFVDCQPYMKANGHEFESSKLFDLESKLSAKPWKATEHPEFAQWLKVNAKPLAIVEEASKRPNYFEPLIRRHKNGDKGMLIGPVNPLFSLRRNLANALRIRCMLSLGEGKPEDAWHDILLLKRMARQYTPGTVLTESFLSMAIESTSSICLAAYLEHGKVTANQLLHQQQELQAMPPLVFVRDSIKLGERYIRLDLIQYMCKNNLAVYLQVHEGMTIEQAVEKARSTPKINLDWDLLFEEGVNRNTREVLEALDRPTYLLKRAALRKLDSTAKMKQEMKALLAGTGSVLKDFKPDSPKSHTDISEKLVNNLQSETLQALFATSALATLRSEARVHQVNQNTIVAFALERYHLDQGSYPARLEDLKPKYLENLPLDLFAEKPLIYKPSDGGYLLYSVGENGKDDGGKGYGDPKLEGDDLRIRMPKKSR